MKYKKLTLDNFLVFHGKHEIEFPSKSGIFLIHALNGVGKSSIYHSLRYVFFGKCLDQQTRNKIQIIDLLSLLAIEEEKYNFSVRIEFEHDGIDYEITRRHQSKVSKTVIPKEDNHFEEKISFIKDGDVLDPKNAKYEIDNLLREDIADFFIVDNEHIGDLNQALKGSDKEFIKKSIDQTIGISILEQGMNDLSAIHAKLGAELNKEIKKSKENEKLSEEFSQRAELFNVSKNSLEILKKEETEISKRVSNLTVKRNKYADIEKNVTEAALIEDKIKNLQKIKETNFQTIQSLLVEEWYMPASEKAEEILVLQDKLLNKQNKLENEIANKKEDIKNYKNGLKNKVCHHCKQDLPASTIKAQETQLATAIKELEVLENKDIENITPHPQEILKFTKVNRKLLSTTESEYYQNLTDISRAEKELKKINESISKGDNAEIRKVQKDLENSQFELREIKTKLAKQESIVNTNRKLLEEVNRKLVKSSTADSSLTQIVEIADNLSGLLSKSFENFSEKARSGVAVFASEAFQQLINYKDMRIGIDEDYVVTLQDLQKKSAGAPSAGQARVTAVSLIAGLSSASVVKAPILIDSPMVGLDSIHQANLYEFFPKLSEQVILLVPPGEWIESSHRKIIKDSISGEITLEKISEKSLMIHDGYKKKYLDE
jgi:DNA sulfur modification protein DndD